MAGWVSYCSTQPKTPIFHPTLYSAPVKRILLSIGIGLLCFTCDREDPPDRNWEPGALTNGFCISFGDSILLNHEDIDYYDFSTHMVYLKEPLPLFEEPFRPDLANMPFTVYALKKPIYSGTLFPAWYSSIPNGAFVQWPPFNPAFIIEIGYRSLVYTTRPDTIPDPREGEQIIEALNRYGQYHPGLSLSVDGIQLDPSGKVSFSYTITNNDSFNYYVLSPEKMGAGLFHFFTNGLTLYNQESGWLTPQMEVITPEPWDSWDEGWFDLLKNHTSRKYTIHYDQFDEIPPGLYDTHFVFPGLHHVEQSDLLLVQGRIWLGEIGFSSEVTIE
jgi:hypothetical protein